jgi:Ca-activated chloride channel family protein
VESVILHFHFLRPFWLLGCIPALVLFGIIWFMRVQSSRWHRAIDRSLLPHLLDRKQGRRQGWPLLVLLLAWLLTSFSLAGPVWKKLPQPVQKKEDAVVIVQDLSLSFYARDLSPDRLARAQHKLKDILDARKEGTTALVVYSGDGHIVSPLTDDSRTIAAMVPALSPGIMPSYGSNVAAAVEIALRLFKDAGAGQGKILLLTDEVAEEDADRITGILRGTGIVLSVLGVGTRDGGPIPKKDGGFLKDEEGNIIVPRLNSPVLERLAADNGGRYREITIDDADIDDLLQADLLWQAEEKFTTVAREFDQWEETGPWLLLLILPLALLGFRRGWIIVIVLAVLLSGESSQAMSWDDLWLRKDQQGAKALAAGDLQRAAELFSSPRWKGIARYRAGNFAEAAAAFGQNESADDHYNRGNSLAKAGKLDEAARAYEQALQLDPEMEDAGANKQLVEEVLRQQQEQQNQQDRQGEEKRQESGDGEQQQDSQGSGRDDQSGGQKAQEPPAGDEDSPEESGSLQQEQSAGREKTEDAAGQDEQTESESEPDNSQGRPSGEGQGRDGETNQLEGRNTGEETEGQPQTESARLSDQPLSGEEQQALEQWLRQVPDDPGGLLRRKFEYEYRQYQGQRQTVPNRKIW